MSKKTPLFERHLELGAKMTDFCGWQMPVQYSGIIDEHNTVRNYAGLFDVSHMGEFFVSGDDALAFLQTLVPQDIKKLSLGKAVYCQLTNPFGGMIDDLIIYRLEEEMYLVIVNASRIEADWHWFLNNKKDYNVTLKNKSENYSLIALQGPKAADILESANVPRICHPDYFSISHAVIDNLDVYIARTGYTGEDGFEILMEDKNALQIWDYLLETGKDYGLKPIGLGARDTLRLEAGLPLYGNDLDDETTPVEAGLRWSVAKNKIEDYHGKNKIFEQIENGTRKKLISFKMEERAIARHEYPIFFEGTEIGVVTSGGYSPTLDKNIGMGFVNTDSEIAPGCEIQIMVRNKLYKALVIKPPFIEKKTKHN